MILENGGYLVDVERTGKGTIDKFRNGDFSLVILNVILPDIGGDEVIRS